MEKSKIKLCSTWRSGLISKIYFPYSELRHQVSISVCKIRLVEESKCQGLLKRLGKSWWVVKISLRENGCQSYSAERNNEEEEENTK